MNWQPIFLSVKLASLTACLLLVICLPIAFWLSWQKKRWVKSSALALVNMPLILPPSVLGFYCLIMFKPDAFIGSLAGSLFNIQLLFSFEGLVVASVIYSFPFMFSALYNGIISAPKPLIESSLSLGKTAYQTSRHVILPIIKPSIISGFVLSFAHTLGEFGVILIIGGNIPNETNVVSVAIFNEVEKLNFDAAMDYSLVLLVTSFVILFAVHFFGKSNYQTLS
jgi:molybdate transport system permease protein